MSDYQVIVIGGGIGGSAAALRAAQYHLRTAWVLGDRATAKASRGRYVFNIDNMIGVHEGVLKPAVLELLEGVSAEAARAVADHHFHIGTQTIIDNVRARLEAGYASHARMIAERAEAIRRDGDGFEVATASGPLNAPYVVLATGVTDRQPRIKKGLPSGKTLDDIHWVFPYANHETLLYCIRCEGHLTAGTATAVMGSSPAAGQIALMLHERHATPVTILTNGDDPDFPARTRGLLAAYGIGIRTERLVDVLGERGTGDLQGFELEGGDRLQFGRALVAMGLHRVFNDLAVELGCELEEGDVETAHVLVDDRSRTSVPGCFAVGDMTTHRDSSIHKQIYTAQEYAVRAVDTVDRAIRAARRETLLGEE